MTGRMKWGRLGGGNVIEREIRRCFAERERYGRGVISKVQGGAVNRHRHGRRHRRRHYRACSVCGFSCAWAAVARPRASRTTASGGDIAGCTRPVLNDEWLTKAL
jgi:hypothetical protein